jgi:23S rRNA (uracil1939-C5)-methyltransferase
MTSVLKAESAVYGGYVLSREGGVVFIRGAIPGEVVEVSLLEKKRDYSVASVTGVLEPSPYRVEPPCAYFGRCGGCQIQYMSYDKQVSTKIEIILDCLRRIGGIETELAPPVLGEPFGYRHRGQFKVGGKHGLMGFYRAGTRDVVDLDECPLMVPQLNEIYAGVRGTDLPGVKEVHITCGGDSMLALLKGSDFEEGLAEGFARMGFSGVAFDDRSYMSRGHVEFDLDGLAYTVSPWSFLQSNWALNVTVARMTAGGLEPLEGKRVLDMYAGAGNFSLPLAGRARKVVALEENPNSVKDGRRNVALNKIDNFKFLHGSAETARVRGDFDIIILNPPRPGLTNAAMQRVLEFSPERLAYISCNPSTLARDLGKLKENYDIASIRMVDFFPNTYHIESLAFLTKR